MYAGYVNKRNSPISPPSMQRTYCVLWGTLLLDYESEEDFKVSMSPRATAEILGVSDWDGQGRAYRYPNGFLLVTHTGGTYYLSALSREDRDEWIVHVKRALECNFANPDVFSFKPSKLLQRFPTLSQSRVCFKTKQGIPQGTGVHCRSCGQVFCSAEFVQEYSTMLQLGIEEAEKFCYNCKMTQACVLWLRTLNYIHVMTIHEFSPGISLDVVRYKATFKLRRRLSTSMEMAAALLEQGDIDINDYEALRQVDHDYRWSKAYEESCRLKEALDAIGRDMHTIIGMLINPHATESRMAYYQVIVKLLEIADDEPPLIDFYLPQIMQAHLLQCTQRNIPSMIKLDILQQALLVLAKKYPPIGLKMIWLLLSTIQDFSEKRVTQVQFAASVGLLIQLEMAATGSISLVADIPTSHVLSSVLIAADHQQHELASDVVTLFLVRRKLQEDYDEESAKRIQRHVLLSGTTPLSKPAISSRGNGELTLNCVSNATGNSSSKSPSSSTSKTCFELLHELGVGQATDKRNRSNSYDSEADISNSDRGGNSEVDLFSIDFPAQVDFVDRLSQLAESLRFIPRENRTTALKDELVRWSESPAKLGWDPTQVAGEPAYRIDRIIVEDCRVFRTKARAPTMVVCVVRRQDVIEYYGSISSKQRYITDSDLAALNSDNAGQKIRKKSGSISECVSGRHETLEQIIEGRDFVDSSISRTISNMQDHVAKGQLNDIAVATPVKSRSVDDFDKLYNPAPSVAFKKNAEHHMYDSNPQAYNLMKSTIQSVTSSDDLTVKMRSTKSSTEEYISMASNHGIHQIETMFKKMHMRKSPSANSLPDLASPPISPPKSTSSRTVSDSRLDRPHVGFSDAANFIAKSAVQTARHSVHVIGSSIATATEPATELANRIITKRPSAARLSMSRKATGLTHVQSTGVEDVLNAARLHSPLAQHSPSSSHVASTKGGSRASTASPAVGQLSDAADIAESLRVQSSAQKLLTSGVISTQEYDQLVSGDGKYRGESARIDAEVISTRIGSAFGESWLSKKKRILQDKYDPSGEAGFWPAWDMRSFIIKSNDDLRQEVCCVQLMELFKEIFDDFGLSAQLWLKPYRIIGTGSTTGVVQVLTDAMSLDALKKTPGFGDLNSFFSEMYSASSESLLQAKRNFIASLAAYSLFTYILSIKDRHNGNILLDTEGHILHIDFGFILSIAPGGSFSLETAPFKLTEEMVDVMGGLESAFFNDFVKAFTAGFLALRANAEPIISSLQVLSINSPFPCFQAKEPAAVIEKLRSRFRLDLSVKDVVQHCLDLVTQSYGNYGTKQYDNFQRYTNGIYQ